MQLSADQKKTVASWLKAGASIAEVQRRLREELQISLTYMDTRFLIDDLGLNLSAPPPAPKPAPNPDLATASRKPAPNEAAVDADAEFLDEDEAFDEAAEFAEPATAEPAGKSAGSVKVEVDRLTRPGTVVSGSVTFSDGKSGSWALDQYGRLIFEAKTAGYRPSQADLQAFQRELSSQLQRHGY